MEHLAHTYNQSVVEDESNWITLGNYLSYFEVNKQSMGVIL